MSSAPRDYRSKIGSMRQAMVAGGWKSPLRRVPLFVRRQDIRLHLVAFGQGVGLIEEPGDRQDFAEHFAVDAKLA
jgi:hypothetical protein